MKKQESDFSTRFAGLKFLSKKFDFILAELGENSCAFFCGSFYVNLVQQLFKKNIPYQNQKQQNQHHPKTLYIQVQQVRHRVGGVAMNLSRQKVKKAEFAETEKSSRQSPAGCYRVTFFLSPRSGREKTNSGKKLLKQVQDKFLNPLKQFQNIHTQIKFFKNLNFNLIFIYVRFLSLTYPPPPFFLNLQ